MPRGGAMPSMRRWEDGEKLKLMRLIRTHSTDWVTIRSHMPERTIHQMRNWWKRFRKTAPERLRAAKGAASTSSDARGKVCRTCGERLSGHVCIARVDGDDAVDARDMVDAMSASSRMKPVGTKPIPLPPKKRRPRPALWTPQPPAGETGTALDFDMLMSYVQYHRPRLLKAHPKRQQMLCLDNPPP